MNVSPKRLKASPALVVKKLGPASVAPKLGEFPLFSKLFPNLADFWDLDKFWPFDFPDFLASSLLPLPILNPIYSPLPFPISGANTLNNLVVFSIKVSKTAILLKL